MDVNIVWIYKTPKKKEVTLTSDLLKAQDALAFSYDMERTGRIKELYFIDGSNTRWKKKELEQLIRGIETEPHEIEAYFDGGYDIQTKQAGIGIVIYYTQNGKRYRMRKNEKFDQLDSNNEAEYAALWVLLRELEELGVHHLSINIKGDSQVVINQARGEWPVYEIEFEKWLNRIEEKVNKLGLTTHFEMIGRKENREADQLATQALQGTFVVSNRELVAE